ncbi:hypothetical protein [Paraburkholderia sp. A3RO-2L]
MFEQLAAHGWSIDRLLKSAKREYETAVGLKQASVWFRKDSEVDQFWLSAQYDSEGCNAAACCYAIVPEKASEDAVAAAVDAFIENLDNTVSQTYAARLLKAA